LYYLSYIIRIHLKTVSARQANHAFSELLSRVELGEEILITKRTAEPGSDGVRSVLPHRLGGVLRALGFAESQ